MKKLISILIIVITLFTISCNNKSEKAAKECETKGIGYVIFTNTSADPYNAFNNSVYFAQIPANKSIKVEAVPGLHEFKVVQVSGYFLYPNEKKESLNVTQCEEYIFTFPAKK